MKKSILSKGLAVAVIVLFLGLVIQPSAAVQPEIKKNDIDLKDYLFKTYIVMSNNPEIKLLTEQYKNDFLKFDIDKGIYKKISNRNPRLFSNIIFTKPSLSIEYFDICYEMGIDIIRFIGEDKVFEIIESFEFPNKEFYYKINNIISKDEELSNGLATLKEMNKVIINNEPYENQFLLCLISVLGVIITMLIFCPIIAIFLMIWEIFPNILQFIGNILVDTYVYIFGVFFDGVVLFCGLPFL